MTDHLKPLISMIGRALGPVASSFATARTAGCASLQPGQDLNLRPSGYDLRHTWASWHVQNGAPLFALQELGGWASTEMVRRYAHLAAEHLAPYAERLGTLRAVAENCNGTKTAQPEKS